MGNSESVPKPPHPPQKKALLVCIRYLTNPALKIDGGDIVTVLKGLIEDYGFAKEDIVLLTDQQPSGPDALPEYVTSTLPHKNIEAATRANIMKSFHEFLLYAPQNGDVLFFYYSGHGSLVTDGTNELGAICPQDVKKELCDYKRFEHVDAGVKVHVYVSPITAYTNLITSVDVEQLLKNNLTSLPGCNLTLLFNSCYSSGCVKGPEGKTPVQPNLRFPGASIAFNNGSVRSGAGFLTNPNCIFLASSQLYTVSADQVDFAKHVFEAAKRRLMPQTDTYANIIADVQHVVADYYEQRFVNDKGLNGEAQYKKDVQRWENAREMIEARRLKDPKDKLVIEWDKDQQTPQFSRPDRERFKRRMLQQNAIPRPDLLCRDELDHIRFLQPIPADKYPASRTSSPPVSNNRGVEVDHDVCTWSLANELKGLYSNRPNIDYMAVASIIHEAHPQVASLQAVCSLHKEELPLGLRLHIESGSSKAPPSVMVAEVAWSPPHAARDGGVKVDLYIEQGSWGTLVKPPGLTATLAGDTLTIAGQVTKGKEHITSSWEGKSVIFPGPGGQYKLGGAIAAVVLPHTKLCLRPVIGFANPSLIAAYTERGVETPLLQTVHRDLS
eukprot:CAMPEP_0177664876 /NCGR_PEP_ID=MMETSP0447-20121125/20748_1 /TAXON_ID=0 /ORGANISM="Stygamoeba regulata, Strain BSH-02190019" /LENGTH=610 /DNA_ID=CAMNT_0019170919 /DNA_START=239 /DNA_END=2068 /DNA_ORIENTATION=-